MSVGLVVLVSTILERRATILMEWDWSGFGFVLCVTVLCWYVSGLGYLMLVVEVVEAGVDIFWWEWDIINDERVVGGNVIWGRRSWVVLMAVVIAV